MFVNKKVLGVAIAGVLFAGAAQAAPAGGVDISATPVVPVKFASESVVPSTGPLTLTNTGNALDLTTKLKYSFTDGEVRQARIECSDNMTFATGSGVTLSSGAKGAINGLGSNAIYFSITGAAGSATDSDQTITITGNRTVSSTAPVSCTYGLYDTPSQAAHGGSEGLIVSATGNYISYGSTYALTTTAGSNTADVEAGPAFSDFKPATGSLAAIGDFAFALAASVPLNPAGNGMVLGDILDADTTLVFEGDFSRALDIDGEFDPNAVFIGSKTTTACDTVNMVADDVDASSATFKIGAAASSGTLCYQADGAAAIPVADYTVSLIADAKDTTKFNAPDIAAKDLGSIVHNGTELQAPLVNVPTGWISRLALTNTGSADRPYTITVQTEDGVTIDTANTTGTIKANSTKVIDNLGTVLTKFSTGAKARATLNVSVAGPNNDIQGQYQLVSPEGSLSNYILTRPGMN